jgi:hypothetical protein
MIPRMGRSSAVLRVAGGAWIFDVIRAFRYHARLSGNLIAWVSGYSTDRSGRAAMPAGASAGVSAIWWTPSFPIRSLIHVAVGTVTVWRHGQSRPAAGPQTS